MKRYIRAGALLGIAVVLVSALAARAQADRARPAKRLMISSGRVGPLNHHTALRRSTLERRLRPYRVQVNEEIKGRIYVITRGRQRLLKIWEGSMEGIYVDVLHPSIRTRSGIGIGATRAEVERKYPDLSCHRVHEHGGPRPGDYWDCETSALADVFFEFDRTTGAGKKVRLTGIGVLMRDPIGR